MPLWRYRAYEPSGEVVEPLPVEGVGAAPIACVAGMAFRGWPTEAVEFYEAWRPTTPGLAS